VPPKPTIFRSVSAGSIAQRVAKEYCSAIDVLRLADETYTVISFPSMRGQSSSVIDSTTLERSLAKARVSGEPLVAVAHSFTAEARASLDAIGAYYFFTSDHYWSDESWSRIHSIREGDTR
jgi:hypothetical protein